MSSVKDVTASAKTINDISVGTMSLLYQILKFLLLAETRSREAVNDEEKRKFDNDVEKLRAIKEKMEQNPFYTPTKEETEFLSQFSIIPMGDHVYNAAVECLDKKKANGDIGGYQINLKTNDRTFEIILYSKDADKIPLINSEIMNTYENSKSLTKEQLLAMTKNKVNGKDVHVVAMVGLEDKDGITQTDLEMLKNENHDFRYHIGEDKDGKTAIYVLDSDVSRLKRQMLENRISLSSRAKERIILDKAMHDKELFENLNTKNGKNVYLCCPDNDMCIKIGDDTFEVFKNGKSLDLCLPNQTHELVGGDGEEHFINSKLGNEMALETYTKLARYPIILEENEFIKDFSARQYAMKNKLLAEIDKKGERPEGIEEELDRLFDPSVSYKLYEPSENVKQWLEIVHPAFEKKEKEEQKKEDLERKHETAKDWHERKQLEHQKLSMDKDYNLSNRTMDAFDFSQKIIEARENNRLNNEFKKEVIEEYKELDLNEKEDMIRILSGMTPEECKAISSHITDYVEENSLDDHIEFVEVSDPRVSEYWNMDRDRQQERNERLNERTEQGDKEIEDVRDLVDGDGDLNGNYLPDYEEERHDEEPEI